jgi:hypothetical protein
MQIVNPVRHPWVYVAFFHLYGLMYFLGVYHVLQYCVWMMRSGLF